MTYFFQGLAVALASIAPIGVQNLFVINSAVSHKRGQALVCAAAVFLFDMSLTLAAFFGMGELIRRWTFVRQAALLVGGIIVLKIGLALLFARGGEITRESREFSLRRTIATAFVVTWFNPQALVDTTLFFGAFRASLPPDAVPPFILGCLAASPLWFTSITLAINAFSAKIGPRFLRALNVICGAVIVFYGSKLILDFIELVRG